MADKILMPGTAKSDIPLHVKRLTPDDTELIDAVVNGLIAHESQKPSPAHLQTLLTDNRTHLYAALAGDQPIGYALVYTFPSLYTSAHLAYLYDIEVLEAHRRQGAGRLLMDTLLADLQRNGVSELFLGTAADNPGGQALFRASGGLQSGDTFHDFTWEW